MWQLPSPKSAAFIVVAAIALGATPARAACGSPPDPRSNSAGYASWCSCMGGSYNYQTTACTGAHGPSTGGGNAGSSNNWPAQHWYCRARASNGAWGWGRYGDRAAAERRALSECDGHARGRACRITGCQYVGGTPPPGIAGSPSAPSPPDAAATPPATAPVAPPFGNVRPAGALCGGKRCLPDQQCGPRGICYNPSLHYICGTTRCVIGKQYSPRNACAACNAATAPAERAAPASPFPFTAYTCERCYRKLKSDIRFGWITQRRRSYIGGAISAYEGCKQKATGVCQAGDGFRTAVRGCASDSFNDAGSRACVEQVLTNDPGGF